MFDSGWNIDGRCFFSRLTRASRLFCNKVQLACRTMKPELHESCNLGATAQTSISSTPSATFIEHEVHSAALPGCTTILPNTHPPHSRRRRRAHEENRIRHGRAPPGRSQDDMPSKTPHTNGNEPLENGVNATKDVEMKDDAPAPLKGGKGKKLNEKEEEMTVVVPPSKGSKLSAPPPKDTDGDVAMDGPEDLNDEDAGAVKIDPVAKAVSGSYPIHPLENRQT